MTTENERMRILEMISSGKISAGDGVKLLNALEGDLSDEPDESEAGEPAAAPEGEFSSQAASFPEQIHQDETQDSTSPAPVQSAAYVSGEEEMFVRKTIPGTNLPNWRRWLWAPLWFGVGVTTLGGLLMFWAWQATRFSFWFACSWIPFFMGVAIIALAWGGSRARWLHVRVHQQPGAWPQKISISLPLPLGMIAWLLRTFARHNPKVGENGLDELILALKNTSPETPFYVEVDEGVGGERVEVFIG